VNDGRSRQSIWLLQIKRTFVANLTILRNAVGACGWASAPDRQGRTIWTVDAHRDDGRSFVVRADEKLTAFLQLESAMGAIDYYLLSASLFNTSQPTTTKLVPPPQPTKSWPPSAMAYSVSSSPSCECFRTVARTTWFLCMLSMYTSVKLEFPPQPPDTTRIFAQLARSPDCAPRFQALLLHRTLATGKDSKRGSG
jgi:hypothetical protein